MKRNGSKTVKIKLRAKPASLEMALSRAVEHAKRMTAAERRQSLIDAGIMTASGKLAPMYR